MGKKHSKKTKNKIGEASLGRKHSEATKQKMRKPKTKISNKGNTHHNWKGNNVSVGGLHDWLRNMFGKPKRCEHCGTKGFYRKFIRANKEVKQWSIEYAKKTECKYERKRENFLTLCYKCHKKYDNN